MKHLTLKGIVVALVLAALMLTWQLANRPASDTAPPAATTPSAITATSHTDDDFGDWVSRGRQLGELPPSMRDTEVDGGAHIDQHGQLIIDGDLRLMFEYFLAAIGEEDLDDIRARIAAWLARELPEDAAREAWAVLERYLGYKEALADMAPHDGSMAGMKQSLAASRDLRRAWLGQEIADAFFGFEDAYDEYMLGRMEIEQNDNLSEAEKQARLDLLQADWPDEVREAMFRTRAPAEVASQVQQLREQGAEEYQVRQLREQHFGREAADRLEQLDRQRAEWDSRYDAYRQALTRLAETHTDSDTFEQERQQLREQLFNETERRRVEALDRIAGD